MFTIFKLFGNSPFSSLRSHMQIISSCVHKLSELFDALKRNDKKKQEEVVAEIADLEHKADLIKNDIRNHLPNSLFLPINKSQLLELLTLQDTIADRAEDVAILTTYKDLTLTNELEELFQAFLIKNIDTFDKVHLIMNELQELIESSFGGKEAEKVRDMVDVVAYQEHEIDIMQVTLVKKLVAAEKEMSYTTFFFWQKIFEALADISNYSEKLAWRVRRTLELK